MPYPNMKPSPPLILNTPNIFILYHIMGIFNIRGAGGGLALGEWITSSGLHRELPPRLHKATKQLSFTVHGGNGL